VIKGDLMTDKTDSEAGCLRWQELQGKLTNKTQGLSHARNAWGVEEMVTKSGKKARKGFLSIRRKIL